MDAAESFRHDGSVFHTLVDAAADIATVVSVGGIHLLHLLHDLPHEESIAATSLQGAHGRHDALTALLHVGMKFDTTTIDADGSIGTIERPIHL